MRLNTKNMLAGLVVVCVGAAFAIGATNLRIGSLQRMDSGYFPLLIGIVTVWLGLAVCASAWAGDTPIPKVPWRPLLAVLASIALFAVLVRSLGLVPAVIGCILVSALGDRSTRPVQVVLLALLAALGTWLIFVVGLGLPMRPFRGVG